ncbi:MAG: hypothetical protein R2824_04110 [Saprospiraceae bacterium]|nr:hypothetical protein [Lewinella sp.]
MKTRLFFFLLLSISFNSLPLNAHSLQMTMSTSDIYADGFLDRCPAAPAETMYINKTGTVNSVKRDVTTFRSTTDWVTINLSKTGGKAHTIVQIYANNLLVQTLEFENGTKLTAKSYTITQARSKNIKIEMINKSVGNTFQYSLKCTGENTCRQNETAGTVEGGQSKNYDYSPQCNSTRIRITRTGGRAAGKAEIWNRGQLVKTLDFPRGVVPDTKWHTLQHVENSLIRIVIRNLADPSKELRYECVINEFNAP